MAPPAGERYLRLLLERILGSGIDQAAGPGRIVDAGEALVAVGEIGSVEVLRLHDDLALALALRRPSPDPSQLAAGGRRTQDTDLDQPLRSGPGGMAATPRAVAAGVNRFVTPEGVLVVEYVSFGDDGATLVETIGMDDEGAGPPPARRNRRLAAPPTPDPVRGPAPRQLRWPPRSRRESGGGATRQGPSPRMAGPGVPPRSRPVGPGREQLRITDDRGREYRRGPGDGGVTADGWRWAGALEPAPPADVAWLQISLGDSTPARLEVTPPAGVTRGRSHGRSPGETWLLAALQAAVATSLRRGGPPDMARARAGAEALVALGHLGGSDPLVIQVELLADRPDGGGDLDRALGSALGGRLRTGPEGVATVPLARIVDLGDRTARLDVAVVDEGAMRVSGWFSPWASGGIGDDTDRWHLSGFDDRHNHYVATVGDLHRSPAGADVTWHLWPALDPSARTLRLVVAGPSTEAPVEVVMP